MTLKEMRQLYQPDVSFGAFCGRYQRHGDPTYRPKGYKKLCPEGVNYETFTGRVRRYGLESSLNISSIPLGIIGKTIQSVKGNEIVLSDGSVLKISNYKSIINYGLILKSKES